MGHNVFVYGSLMFDAVYKGVTGRLPEFADARLPGFRRFAVVDVDADRPYPAMLPEPGGVVDGKIAIGVTDSELAELDKFEEVETGLYSRHSVTVEGPNGTIEAQAYVAGESLRPKLSGDWDPEVFEKLQLPKFLAEVFPSFHPDR